MTQATSCDKPAGWSWCYQDADAVRYADAIRDGIELLTMTFLLMTGASLLQVVAKAQAHELVHFIP